MTFDFLILEKNLVNISVNADSWEEARKLAMEKYVYADDKMEVGCEILSESVN